MQTEVIGFIIVINIVLLLLIGGIIFFIVQYNRRRKKHDMEKYLLDENHKTELFSVKLDTQQQTMLHIGREIHDNVGQKLTLASLYTKQLSSDKMMEIATIIDESLTELRQLSKSLTNPLYSSGDLIDLLKEEAVRINTSGVCHISIVATTPAQLSPANKHIVFRLLQEFIQNSLKHAACRKIEIILSKTDRQLHIKAYDDGKGFDSTIVSTGIGLQNMQRRSEQLQAEYCLTSEVGKGTCLSLMLNLRG
jgi:signal transduction histidine kinase